VRQKRILELIVAHPNGDVDRAALRQDSRLHQTLLGQSRHPQRNYGGEVCSGIHLRRVARLGWRHCIMAVPASRTQHSRRKSRN
jgi:hypothetical protein